MNTVIAVLAVGIGSYVLRVVPLFITARRPVSARMSHVLESGAMAAVVALLVQDVADAATLGQLVATVAALVTAGAIAMKGRSLAVVIAAGLAVSTLLSHLL